MSADAQTSMPAFGPLAGLRILDITIAYAGAHTTMLLADMGAEIIKVESLQHYPEPSKGPRDPSTQPSVLRNYPNSEPGDDPWNRIAWFNSHGRNKRDFTVDLERERGRELFLRLVELSDGLVENNPPETLEKLGIPPEVLLDRNPSLMIVRMPPLGLSGPDHRAMGFGLHFEELVGMLSIQGYPEGERVSSLHMDAASGAAAASAMLLGLRRRRRTGRGGLAEVTQTENLIHHYGEIVMEAAMNDRVPARWGNRDPDFVPQGVYPCAGDDQWLVLSVRDDADWAALRDALDDPEALRRPELDTASGRRLAHDEIDEVISAWTGSRTKDEAFHLLQRAGIPAGPVLDEADAFADLQLHERGFWKLLEHPSAGTHFHPAHNFQLSRTPPQIWRAAPVLGQDNEYVYKELLGISDEEYAELVAEQHIGDRYL